MKITTENSLLMLIRLIKQTFDKFINDETKSIKTTYSSLKIENLISGLKAQQIVGDYEINVNSEWYQGDINDRAKKFYVDIPSSLSKEKTIVLYKINTLNTTESDENKLKSIEAYNGYIRCYFSSKPTNVVMISSLSFIDTNINVKKTGRRMFKWIFEKKKGGN